MWIIIMILNRSFKRLTKFAAQSFRTMKKHILLLGLITSQLATPLNAQEDMNKWSIGASVGVHDGSAPTAMHTKIYQFHHFGLNGRYMFNNRVGLMLDLGYDMFDAFGSGERNSNYFRTSVQGVVNAGDIIKISTISDRLGLLVHGGAGISNMWINKDFRTSEEANDPLFKGVDDMVNFIFGATPQFKITEKLSINADLAFIFHHNQTYQFDMKYRSNHGAIDGYFVNLSLGASYYFGGKAKHADWVPTVYGGAGSDNSQYEAKVKELEDRLKDDDADGVPNYVDEEKATVKGSFVDSKGRAIKDTDNDGIVDEFDACPTVKGLFSLNGCVDTDGDGMGDNVDACPTVAGFVINKGCPEVTKEVKEVMNRALKGVQFETGKDILIPSSYPVLNDVIKVMMEHPEYKLAVEGHTDNVGNDEDNLILSQKRAQAVGVYLISKGIQAERLDIHGHGETRPKALNDTEEGKALNRRVEFTVIF